MSRKNIFYYFFCCFCCKRDQSEPEIQPYPLTNLKKIEVITQKEAIKLEVSTLKPHTPDIHKYPYLCPICFQYYNKIYKAKCCGNYICSLCVSIMNQKISEDENVKANCFFCNNEIMAVCDVEPSEPIKRYTDSPYIEKLFKKPKKPQKSIFKPHENAEKMPFFISPKYTLNELLAKRNEPELEKLKFPIISTYLTRVNKDFDLARSDGFKGFKMVLKPERRSFEELNLEENKGKIVQSKEIEELMKFKDELDKILEKH